MDATARRLLALMGEMNVRFVVPVYQRPYSWGIEQCERLLDDVRRAGRQASGTHFTGSIVTVQDGSRTMQGVTPLLVIDGQQRITTVSLLLIALARYDRAHPRRGRRFSVEEISRAGYLTNVFRHGEDLYKLTLSKGDERTLFALVDDLLEPGAPLPAKTSRRILENLAYFEDQLARGWDADYIWAGLQALEVVSISLAQGQDKPQVIFESMNSTGKDLSSADLVRNFVLMSYPIEEQDEVYHVYWEPIERTLGTRAYEGVFDDFVHCYLTVSDPLSTGRMPDAYQAFKRYVIQKEYRREDRMRILVLRLARFARYYAAVTAGAVEDEELARALSRIERLVEPQVNPLLLALFDRWEHGTLTRGEFVESLGLVEGYLMRRVVCGCDADALAGFVPSLIARMDAAAEEGASVGLALKIALLNEASGAARFPSDAEFAVALRALVERRAVVAEAGEDEGADAGFDPLLVIEADERVAGSGNLPVDAPAIWARPVLAEDVLAIHRSTAQTLALEEE